MLAAADLRSFAADEDRVQACTYCGRLIFVLPNDRRGGSCFDCLSFFPSEPGRCPECAQEIPGTMRGVGCPNCGWTSGS